MQTHQNTSVIYLDIYLHQTTLYVLKDVNDKRNM